jgi:hypothetical protein
MTDLSLPPRLLARVERSLRKRISIDIRPHLLRAATHSRSQEEFIAAASRLLLNPREREHWLATWERRLQQDQDEANTTMTAPAELRDTTGPTDMDAPVHRSFSVSDSQLREIREALARELGPSAYLLVDAEAEHAGSAVELLARLQGHLPDEAQRARFVNASLLPLNGNP